MGIGDDVMWLADAYQRHLNTGAKQRPTQNGSPTHKGRRLWLREAYQNVPWICKTTGDDLEERPNGKRPYQQHPDYRPQPAPIALTEAEREWAQLNMPKTPYVVINPDAKLLAHYHNNKHWHDPHWQELALQLSILGVVTVRLTPQGKQNTYYPAVNILTDTPRRMMAAIERAAWVITTDGAPHHVAAAFGRPCTVIWGTCTSPHPHGNMAGLSYPGQQNLIAEDPETPCYTTKTECAHCVRLRDSITPQQVIATLDIPRIKAHGR
jgi:ADP-heptose:LPS heptosyltransferase